MFKKFDAKESISGSTLLKSSAQRNIRKDLIDQMPFLANVIDSIIPKKSSVSITKCQDRINLVTVEGEHLFFQSFDGPYIPTLTLLHKYPDMMTKVQVDTGAIKFILGGADVMCPGLTSAGGNLPDGLLQGTPVAIMAQGKESAMAIGIMKMSSVEIKKVNQGHGIENIHYVLDGLWKLTAKA